MKFFSAGLLFLKFFSPALLFPKFFSAALLFFRSFVVVHTLVRRPLPHAASKRAQKEDADGGQREQRVFVCIFLRQRDPSFFCQTRLSVCFFYVNN